MANKKDLSEAQNYSRRRLITAFSSGIPEGMELTPKKNQTPVIVGIGLTLIAIIIGLFYGYLKPSLPENWSNNKLIVAKNSAARYVSKEGSLHPVINAVSARLMIPSADFEVITVDDDQLDGIPITTTLGILGAPDSLPQASELITGSVESCTKGANDIRTVLTDDEHRAVRSDKAIVAHSNDTYYVISGSTRYRLPDDGMTRDAFLRALGIPQTASVEAPIQWINLFEQGSDIAPLTFDSNVTVGNDIHAGSIIMREDDRSQTKYIVMNDGSISALDEYTYGMVAVGRHGFETAPIALSAVQFQVLRNAEHSPLPEDWPSSQVTPVDAHDIMCAVLPLQGDQAVQLVTHTDDDDALSSSASVHNLRMHTSFSGGSGALFQTMIGTRATGTMYVLDSTGTAYPLPQATEEILYRLGYSSADIQSIPRSWIDIFPTGVELTETAAGSQPVAQVKSSEESQ